LAFRFPDTDALVGTPTDRRTLTGPATLAVTAVADPLPCDLATSSCSGKSGLLACVDDLYEADGTCTPSPHSTFSHFTALPVPNDVQTNCFAEAPPCGATAEEMRVAVDAAGNLLTPVNWQGILLSQAGVPIPRLLRMTIHSPLSFDAPRAASLRSFT